MNTQHNARITASGAEPDLCYSDGVDPKQECVFVFTAQDLDVGRLLLDAGMLRRRKTSEYICILLQKDSLTLEHLKTTTLNFSSL